MGSLQLISGIRFVRRESESCSQPKTAQRVILFNPCNEGAPKGGPGGSLMCSAKKIAWFACPAQSKRPTAWCTCTHMYTYNHAVSLTFLRACLMSAVAHKPGKAKQHTEGSCPRQPTHARSDLKSDTSCACVPCCLFALPYNADLRTCASFQRCRPLYHQGPL